MARGLDWEAIKRDWQLNKWTNRELGEKYGCSHTAIQNRAKAGAWVKSLATQIQARTAEMLAIDESKSLEEQQRVQEAALANVEVVRAHKAETRGLNMELDDIRTLLRKRITQLNESKFPPSDATLTLLTRLSESLVRSKARIQAMERKAYGLDEKIGGDADPDLVSDDELIDAVAEILEARAGNDHSAADAG